MRPVPLCQKGPENGRAQIRYHALIPGRHVITYRFPSSAKTRAISALVQGSTVTRHGVPDAIRNGQAGVGGKVPTCERRRALHAVLGNERMGGDDEVAVEGRDDRPGGCSRWLASAHGQRRQRHVSVDGDGAHVVTSMARGGIDNDMVDRYWTGANVPMCQLDHGGAASSGVLTLRVRGSVQGGLPGGHGKSQSVRVLASVPRMHVRFGMGPATGKGGGNTMEMEGESKYGTSMGRT